MDGLDNAVIDRDDAVFAAGGNSDFGRRRRFRASGGIQADTSPGREIPRQLEQQAAGFMVLRIVLKRYRAQFVILFKQRTRFNRNGRLL